MAKLNSKISFLIVAFFAGVFILSGFTTPETKKEPEKSAVYILFSGSNKEQDTIGTASTNDTSRTFVNEVNGANLTVELSQNSKTATFKVPNVLAGTYRIRYLAADSNLYVERYTNTVLGYVVQQVITVGDMNVTARGWTVFLKTGNAIIQVRRD